MMRLVLGLVVLVGIMAGVAFGLPAHVTVTRSTSINAPESAVFPYLNNLHRFSEWSPWQLRDPQLAMTYGGPEQGKGAQVKWTSQKPSVGAGRMEIIESEPNRSIDLVVNFNGLEGTSSYQITPDGSGSKITWNFGFAEYSAGLERLKQKIEAERRPTAPTISLTPGGESSVPGQPAAALPPGTVAPQDGAAPQGAALPPGQAAPAGTAAPAAGTQPDAAAPAAAEATTPTPAPAPKPPKKKRRQ
jgi:hypothetical protein